MSRWIAFWVGLAVLGALWLGPLPGLAASSFTAHMILHMGVVAVAAGLLALGVAGGRFDPVFARPGLFAALPASLLELVVVWAWHAPALHHLARERSWGFAVEQGSFLLVGLYLWLAAFGGGALPGAGRTAPEAVSQAGRLGRAGAGVIGLLLTSMHMTLLGALLALGPRSLYHHPAGGLWGLTPLADQQLGGAVMLLVGGVTYLAGGLWLAAGLVRRRAGAEAGAP